MAIDTNLSLAKLQGAEAAVEEIRTALVTAEDEHRPGLRVALSLLDELRVNLSDYHSRLCQTAERQAREGTNPLWTSPACKPWVTVGTA